MAITITEFLTDRVRVHCCCKMPWGVPDNHVVAEVSYASMGGLPAPPLMNEGHGIWRDCWEESVYIPACEATVSFRFATWQETDDCRMETLIGGPYLGALGPFLMPHSPEMAPAVIRLPQPLIAEHCTPGT